MCGGFPTYSTLANIVIVHPFFSKPDAPNPVPASVVWDTSLGTNKTCLHGVHLSPKASIRVAAFDLDGTLIKSNSFGKSKTGSLAWEWWNNVVPKKLKEVHDDG